MLELFQSVLTVPFTLWCILTWVVMLSYWVQGRCSLSDKLSPEGGIIDGLSRTSLPPPLERPSVCVHWHAPVTETHYVECCGVCLTLPSIVCSHGHKLVTSLLGVVISLSLSHPLALRVSLVWWLIRTLRGWSCDSPAIHHINTSPLPSPHHWLTRNANECLITSFPFLLIKRNPHNRRQFATPDWA